MLTMPRVEIPPRIEHGGLLVRGGGLEPPQVALPVP